MHVLARFSLPFMLDTAWYHDLKIVPLNDDVEKDAVRRADGKRMSEQHTAVKALECRWLLTRSEFMTAKTVALGDHLGYPIR